jgi:formylglycine-generating enzyme required for sulfatase activity
VDTYTFTVQATNAAGSGTKQFTITIVAVEITTTSLPDGVVGMEYSQTLAATSGTPITWTIDSGALPAGLNLGETTGVISGEPTEANTFSFTVKATNAAGDGTKPLSIIITGGGNNEPEIGGMVWIQGGTFTMGSPTGEADRYLDETQHEVTLTGFYMGKHPVTQAQYEAVTGSSNPSAYSSGGYRAPYVTGLDTANFPVEQVTWYDAVEFCNKLSEQEGLTKVYTITSRWPTAGHPITGGTVTPNWSANGYRLPTEAQWEYACRAGTTTAFNTGNNITTEQANYNGQYPYNDNPEGIYRERTTEVGTFAPNTLGLYDMHGNVYEWCWDLYGNYATGTQTDPTGAFSGFNRVRRGGSFFSEGHELRSAYRTNDTPSFYIFNTGFRIVRPAE